MNYPAKLLHKSTCTQLEAYVVINKMEAYVVQNILGEDSQTKPVMLATWQTADLQLLRSFINRSHRPQDAPDIEAN